MMDPSMLMPLLSNSGGNNSLGKVMPLLSNIMSGSAGNNNEMFLKLVSDMNPKLKPIMAMLPKMLGEQPQPSMTEAIKPTEQYELQYNRPYEPKKRN